MRRALECSTEIVVCQRSRSDALEEKLMQCARRVDREFEQDHSMVEHLREQLQLAQMQIAQLQHKVNTSLVLWL